jgi:SAM-dependent methyltransferase
MTFDVAAAAYGRFMGRFSEPLASLFLELVELTGEERALDVGCVPGALTAPLVRRLGEASVWAIDPSPPFVAAVQARFPELDARTGSAEALPYADGFFDVALAQLVVHFMADPVAGLREMGRVTRPGGWVAACVWDHGGGGSPLDLFWRAVRDVDPTAHDESALAGAREGHLGELCRAAGLFQLEESSLTVSVSFSSFHEWWEPFTLGVGPAGAYVASLDGDALRQLRDRCRQLLPSGAFDLSASAWAVRARTSAAP